MTPKEMREIGAQALRDNKHKGTDHMRMGLDRCCLCVMQDAYYKECANNEGDYTLQDNYYPHVKAMRAYGLEGKNPELPVPVMYLDGNIRIHMTPAAFLNDGGKVGTPIGGMPHNLIAECLENFGEEPGERKWTFYLKLIPDRLATDIVIVNEYWL